MPRIAWWDIADMHLNQIFKEEKHTKKTVSHKSNTRTGGCLICDACGSAGNRMRFTQDGERNVIRSPPFHQLDALSIPGLASKFLPLPNQGQEEQADPLDSSSRHS